MTSLNRFFDGMQMSIFSTIRKRAKPCSEISILCDECIELVDEKLKPGQTIFDYPPEYYGFCKECMNEIHMIRITIG